MIRRAALLASAAFALTTAAYAAPDVSIRNSVAVCNPNAPTQCQAPNADGSTNSRVQPGTAVGSTDASGTVATANTYQTIQAANSARKGCLIVNTSANAESLRINTTVIPLAANQQYSCAAGLIVNGDPIAITSPTAGSAYSALFE